MGSKSNFSLWILVLSNAVFDVGTAEKEGSSVTLHTGVQDYEQIKWIFKPQNGNGEEEWYIAGCRVNDTPRCEITLRTDEQINTFKDRLKIHNNGSLTIKNLSIEKTGLYTLQIIDKSKQSYKCKFNVSVSSPAPKTVNESDQTKQPSQPDSGSDSDSGSGSGLSPGYKALIGVLVLVGVVGVAVAGVFFYKRRKARLEAGRNGCAAYHYEKKNGSVSSINSHPEDFLRINGEP